MASMTIIAYQGWLMLLHAIFPLMGISLLWIQLLVDRFTVKGIALALPAFFFTPFLQLFLIWSSRSRNKIDRGPYIYRFDSEGMHVGGLNFQSTIRWAAIPRIRLSKRFLLVFITPTKAHVIPLRSLTVPEDLSRLRSIASVHTDFR